uniref:Filamin-like 1 n=1 Tax=Halisarca dujardinii TaxID=2583056 RepID=A0A9F1UCT5_HALDU|nr:filamin-like 1 [Halisarca dujardinii]
MTSPARSDWKEIQEKAFTNWSNDVLKSGKAKGKVTSVESLADDLQDGLALIQMLETVAAPRKVGPYHKSPKIKPQIMENLGTCLKFLNKEGIKVVNIGPEDIFDKNAKLVLGLVWTIVRHYQLHSSDNGISTKAGMLGWVSAQIPDVIIKNFNRDWNNGIALCKLVERYKKGAIPNIAQLNPARGLENCRAAMMAAQEQLGIPLIINPEDLTNPNVDDLSVMTYLSYFIKIGNNVLLMWLQSLLPDRNITNLTSDWSDGISLAYLLNAISPGLISNLQEWDRHQAVENITRCMTLAEQVFSIKSAMSPSQMANPNIDELSVSSYLCFFMNCRPVDNTRSITAYGPGLRVASVGKGTHFLVDTTRSGGKGHVQVVIPNAVVATQQEPGQVGQIRVNYTPRSGGKTPIDVKWNGHHIVGSPFYVNILDMETLELEGLRPGMSLALEKPCVFRVKGVYGGELVEVTVRHSAGQELAKIIQRGKGEYEVSYTPRRLGGMEIDVRLGDLPLPGSPFDVNVVDPSQCQISMTEPEGTNNVLIGKPAHFAITASEENIRGISIEVHTPSGTKFLQPLMKEKNLYSATFSAGDIGFHTVVASCGGVPIRGSPIELNVVSSSKCTFVSPLPRFIPLTENTTLKISTKYAGDAGLDCSSNNPSVCGVSLKKDVGGLYSLILAPRSLGEAMISTTFAGVPLQQTPFPVGVVDPTQCLMEEDVLARNAARVKQPLEFPINVAGAGRGEMRVMLKGPTMIYGGEARDTRDGNYRIRIQPQEMGQHAVEVLWCGLHIPGSPFVMRVEKTVALKSFRLEGEFQNCIATRSTGGILRAPERGLLPRMSVHIEGEGLFCDELSASLVTTTDQIQAVIQDSGDSTYVVNYAIPKPGSYLLSMLVESQHIPGSPFQLTAHPAPDSDQCHPLGEMLDPNKYFSLSRPIEFKVDVSKAGVGQLVVKGRDPLGAEEPLYCGFEEVVGHRVYTVRFAPRMIGCYVIDAFWDGSVIRGSPFYFRVVDPNQVKLMGVPQYDYIGCVGNLLQISADTRQAGLGAPFKVIALYSKEEEEVFEVVPGDEPGKFESMFTPRTAGSVSIMPYYNNDPLLRSPVIIEIYNPAHYTVTPPEMMGKLKEYVKFPIVGLTNQVRGLTLSAKHPNHDATVKLEPKGELQVARFTPKHTGAYQVEVKVAGSNITNSPFTVNVCSPTSCKIMGHFPTVLLTNVPQTVQFVCGDAGPGELLVETICTSGPLTLNSPVVQVNKDIWEVALSSAFVGANQITVKWGDYVICNSPLTLNIVDTSNVSFKCPQLRNNSFAYSSDTFDMLMDAAQAGGVKPEVVARGPKDRYNVKIKTGKSNNYIASFTPWQVGETTVEILIAGQTVVGTPFRFDSIKRIDPKLVQVTGYPMKQCIGQRPQEVSIITPEAGLIDSGRLVVSMTPLSKASTPLPPSYEVEDNGGGNYVLSFTFPEIITYSLKVTVDEQPAKGSPFTLQALNPPESDRCKVMGALAKKTLAFAVGSPVEFQVDVTDAGIGELNVRVVSDNGDDEIVYIAEPRAGVKRKVWSVRYEPKSLGRFTVIATFGGSALPRSPYPMYICDPPKCVFLDLPNPAAFTPFLNELFTVTVDTRDAGKGSLKSFIRYPNGDIETLEVDEGTVEKEGVFTIPILPRRLGMIELHVLFNDFPLLSPPWCDEVADPGGFNVIPPTGIWKRHSYVKFNVFGVKPTTRNVSIKAYHPEHDAVVTLDFAEGHGICQFTPKQIGEYTVEANCAGAPMGNSPFIVPVCDPANCRIVGDVPDLLIVNRETQFIVDGEEAGPGTLTANWSVYTGQDPLTISVERRSEHSSLVRINPHDVGMVKVALKWAQYHLSNFPRDIKIIDVDRCVVSLPQMYGNTFVSGSTFEVKIDAREVGRVTPEVHLLGPQGPYQGNMIDHKNGLFTASFIPWQLDMHRLEILFSGALVSMCPFEFEVVKPLDVDKMGINPASIGTIIAGVRTDISMVAHDTGLVDRDAVEFTILPLELDGPIPHQDLLAVTPKDNGNGTYTGYFGLPVPGTYTFNCFVEGKHVRGSPCTVFCQRGPEVDKIRVSGSLVDTDKALTLNSIVEIELDVTDAGFGNLLAQAQEYTGVDQAVYTREETKNGRKIRKVRIEITETSTYELDMYWGGERVPGSPYKFDVVSPEDTIVDGLPLPNNGIIPIDHPISFSVDMSKGGAVTPEVSVSVPGGSGQMVERFSKEGLVHFYKLETLELGILLVTIKVGGHMVPGSPFRCEVVDPSMYGIVGLDLQGKSALVGQPVRFSVKGAFQDRLSMSSVAHGPGATIPIEMTHDDAHTYSSQFVPVEAGLYNVFVEYGGDNVVGSPFPIPVVDPSRVEILGELPNFLHVGEEDEIVVKTRSAGNGELKLMVNDRAATSLMYITLESKAQDTYSLVLKTRQVGTARLDIRYGGYTIPTCPFITELLNASQVVVQCDAFKEEKSIVGDAIKIEVMTEGAGQGELLVQPKGKTSVYSVNMVRQDDAVIYVGEFVPWETGEHTVDVLWGGRHAPGSPFNIMVNMTDTDACTASGEGLSHAVAGLEAHFSILSSEVGLVEKGLLSVTVKGVNKNGQVTIKDGNDGTYSVSYVVPSPGAYVVGIFYRNKSIKGSPYKVNAVPGPDASKVQVYGPAMHPNSIHISGVPLEFYVDPSKGGSGELQVFIRGPNDYRPKVYDQKSTKGIYTLKFDALVSGKYLVFVLWSKVQVPGSPFRVRVYPAPDASKVKAYGPGLEDGLLGTDGEFYVETREAGIGSLSIRVHGIKDGFKVDAIPLPDDPRTLTCTYSPLRAGEYVIFVRWSGHHVPGSPFRIRIFKPKARYGEQLEEDEEAVNPIVQDILSATDSNVLPALRTINVPMDTTLAEDVAYLGKKKLPKEGKVKKKYVRKSSSKGELKQVTMQSGISASQPVGQQMLMPNSVPDTSPQETPHQGPRPGSPTIQYAVHLEPMSEEDPTQLEAEMMDMHFPEAENQQQPQQRKKSGGWFRRFSKSKEQVNPEQISDEDDGSKEEKGKRRKSWFSRPKKSGKPSRPSIQENIAYEDQQPEQDPPQAGLEEPHQTNVTVVSQDNQGQMVEEKLNLDTSGKVVGSNQPVNGNLSDGNEDDDKWAELGGDGFKDVSKPQYVQ